MKKEDYKKIRNLAWEVLIDQEVSKLPIDIIGLCNNMGIKVYTFTGDFDGYTTKKDGHNVIFYNSDIKSPGRVRFTIAHELGHILLEQFNITYDEKEKEANMFAIRLLAPVGVLNELNVQHAIEISLICDISLSASRKRLARLKMLRERDMFKTSKLERQVLRNFKEFIENYKE